MATAVRPGAAILPPAPFRPPTSGLFTMHGAVVDLLDPDRATGRPRLILQYHRARYDDVKNARWLQRDPSGYADGANLYESFGGNPGRFTDPDGRYTKLYSTWGSGDEVLWQHLGWFGRVHREFSLGQYYCVRGEKVIVYREDSENPGWSYVLPFTMVEGWARRTDLDSYEYERLVRLHGHAVDRYTGEPIRRSPGEEVRRFAQQVLDEEDRRVQTLLNTIDFRNLIAAPVVTALTGEDILREETVPPRYRVLAGVETGLLVAPLAGPASRALGLGRTSAAGRTISLPILNPSFTPEAEAVLRSLVTQQNARLAGDLSLGRIYLSPAELRAAQSKLRVAQMSYGNVLERMVGEQISTDPLLSTFLNPIGIRSTGPDVLGIGHAAGQTFDITTRAAAHAHLLRPYGPGLTIIEYERPLSFTVFP